MDAESSQPSLRLAGVIKSYGAIRALDGVDFSVSPGEFVALLGPNGAGKSTLFQILSGLFTADAGTIHVLGTDLAEAVVPVLSKIGVVFQQPTLDLDLSVRANLRFHARLHGLNRNRQQQRIDSVIAQLGLQDYQNSVTRSLSGGYRRKVELARALIHEPDILLMDEPTVGLDPASRADLVAVVRRLCDEAGVAVLWATHLVDEAEQANRVIILHRGKILLGGTPDEVVESGHYASLQAGFLALTDSRHSAPASAG